MQPSKNLLTEHQGTMAEIRQLFKHLNHTGHKKASL